MICVGIAWSGSTKCPYSVVSVSNMAEDLVLLLDPQIVIVTALRYFLSASFEGIVRSVP